MLTGSSTDVAELDHLLTTQKSELGVAETNTEVGASHGARFPRSAPVA